MAHITLQVAWYQVGMCTLNRTFHSTGGLGGRTSGTSRLLTRWRESKSSTYEDASTASSGWALATKTLDFAIRIYLVILQDRHLDFLALMFDLFWGLRARHSLVK
jgi:hypothetical protein